MLDERSRTLLKTLVEHYIADGQPVGSRALSKFSGLDLSPATIRNVMADLEEAGFVASPHTSAGRIPTARGYRLFVDSLLTVQPLEARQMGEMKESLHGLPSSQIIASASQLLSSLSTFARSVIAPRRPARRNRQIQLLRLSETARLSGTPRPARAPFSCLVCLSVTAPSHARGFVVSLTPERTGRRRPRSSACGPASGDRNRQIGGTESPLRGIRVAPAIGSLFFSCAIRGLAKGSASITNPLTNQLTEGK